MRQVTGNMTSVVRGMDVAMDSMNIDKVRHHAFSSTAQIFIDTMQISLVMDRFESQFSDLDVQTSYMEDTMSSTTAVSMPTDQVDLLLQQVAEEANIELQHEMGDKVPDGKVADLTPGEKLREEDSKLAERLRALRPAS